VTREQHLEKAGENGTVAGAYMRRAATEPVNDVHDYNGLHCVRMARLAVYHAFKARPDLRPPDSYDDAREEFRRRRAAGDIRYPWI